MSIVTFEVCITPERHYCFFTCLCMLIYFCILPYYQSSSCIALITISVYCRVNVPPILWGYLRLIYLCICYIKYWWTSKEMFGICMRTLLYSYCGIETRLIKSKFRLRFKKENMYVRKVLTMWGGSPSHFKPPTPTTSNVKKQNHWVGMVTKLVDTAWLISSIKAFFDWPGCCNAGSLIICQASVFTTW